MITVSVIIPVFNGEKYLDECIESAINQTYQDIEIITVNDGSTDNTAEILKKYTNKIKIITKKNGGISSALNAGIKVAQGEWIKWLSADDSLYPDCIEELILATEKLEDKEKHILYSNYDYIDSEGKITSRQIEHNYNDLDDFEFNVILLDHFIGNGTTSLIHRSVIDRFGLFDSKLSHSQDYELWLRYSILHNCRLHLIPKILAKYRIHQGQMTKSNIKKSIEQAEMVRKNMLDKIGPEKRKQYEIALQIYKKKKPFVNKCKDFMRYTIFRVLPEPISVTLRNFYWNIKRLKK